MNNTIEGPERTLLQMLATKRPHGSHEENHWVHLWLIEPLLDLKPELVGPMGNVVVKIGQSDTLFSCHTDTVHAKGGIQTVMYDETLQLAYKDDGECLGADDTTGVWLMREMIMAGVPGTYVFHRGEERGGIGSVWMKNNKADWLKQFKRAVAFDRRDTCHVITRQRGQTCCSDEFGKALATMLGAEWKLETGTFTDTANYTALIPECTNISIGYDYQHTKEECQDVGFALELLNQCIALQWETLPVVREAKEETWGGWQSFRGGFKGSRQRSFDDWDFDWRDYASKQSNEIYNKQYDAKDDVDLNIGLMQKMMYTDLVKYLRDMPATAAYTVRGALDKFAELQERIKELEEDVKGLEEEVDIRDRLIGKLRAERKPLSRKFLSALGGKH